MTTFSNRLLKPLTAALFALAATATLAQPAPPVQVSKAWVRTTVPGQQSTGAYMALTANTAMTLVSVTTPAAGIVEVHEMKMDGDIMRMREVPQLELLAGKTVELKPGGLHVMLMDLKQPFVKNTQVPVTLRFKNAKGVESTQQVMLPVAMTPPATAVRK